MNSAADYLQRAHEHESQHRYADALHDCDAALAIDPTLAPAYLLRAIMRFFNCGNPYASVLPTPSEAARAAIVADFQQASELAGDDGAVLLECANWMATMRGLGMVARAIEIYTTLIERDPTECAAYLRRGIAYMFEERHADAIADYSTAIQIEPNKPDAYAARGRVYETLRQRDLAAADFGQALTRGYDGFDVQWVRDYVGRYGSST